MGLRVSFLRYNFFNIRVTPAFFFFYSFSLLLVNYYLFKAYLRAGILLKKILHTPGMMQKENGNHFTADFQRLVSASSGGDPGNRSQYDGGTTE